MTNPIIERFEFAVRIHVDIEAHMPVYQQHIEAEYQEAKKELEKLVEDAINLQILPHVIPKAE